MWGGQKEKLLVWFAEVGKGDIALVGGKGANLGELTKAGLPVPSGFIITSAAFFQFLRENKIDKIVAKKLQNLDPEDSKTLQKLALQLQEAVKKHPLPAALSKEILKAYKELGEGAVAVRSSATAEDLPDASFAGQQATFLNTEGEAQLIKAIRECWASLFEARAIYYRAVQKYDQLKVGIAVPVQRMVQSEVSGIMFTVDPVSGDTDKLVIDAGLGLGEAIVSGSITPDHFVVSKKDQKITAREIGAQDWQIIRGENGKDKHVALTKEQKEGQKLSDERILKVAEMGEKIEKHYGAPQDTEWAWESKNLYFVQSRPITTLKSAGQLTVNNQQLTGTQQQDTETKGEKAKDDKGQVPEGEAKVLVTGAGASVGRASGPVRIIHKPTEIDKVIEGDVLVTEMTSPDYVPAMRRAVAIVTDTGGRTCFAAQTKILTDRGFIKIDEVPNYLNDHEQLLIPSLNKETLKVEWKKIKACLISSGETIEISVSQKGNSTVSGLEVTPNHRFLTLENRMLVEDQISNLLNKEMGVLSITNLPGLHEHPEAGDEDMAYLIGAIGTDGSIYRSRTHGEVQLIQKDTPEKAAFVSAVRKSFQRVFGYELRPHLKKASVGYLGGRLITGEAMAYRCYSKEIANTFYAREQSVGTAVLENDRDFSLSFIGGAMDGDGTYNPKTNRANFYGSEPHIYEPFIVGCLRNGVLPQVCRNRTILNIQLTENVNRLLSACRRVKSDARRVKFGSRLFAAKQILFDVIESVNFKGRTRPYVEKNLFLDADKLKRDVLPMAGSKLKAELEHLLNSDLRMLRVKFVKKGSRKIVYNLTVEDNHNYLVFTDGYIPVVVANSHASIVSRELGIPCVVGTGTATSALKTGQMVTVDGTTGQVYEGKLHPPAGGPIRQLADQLAITTTSPAAQTVPITATKVYLNIAEPEKAAEYATLPVDGVGLMRAEFIIAGIGEHPKAMVKDGRAKEYVQKLSLGITTIAQAFHPRPVVYRATDFKTNEYRSLKGGAKLEPQESNPMIGYRGASRYIAEPELFALELEAIRSVREGHDMTNLHLMIPFVRTVEEYRKVRDLVHQSGLRQGSDFKLWIMVEVPSTVWEIDKYIPEGIDGVSIGSNDLTQLMLGVDRDSATLAYEFDERYPAVMEAMLQVIRACRKNHVTVSICGQAPSVYPEITEALVKAGITSVSVAPDVAVSTRKLIASVERKLLLNHVLDG